MRPTVRRKRIFCRRFPRGDPRLRRVLARVGGGPFLRVIAPRCGVTSLPARRKVFASRPRPCGRAARRLLAPGRRRRNRPPAAAPVSRRPAGGWEGRRARPGGPGGGPPLPTGDGGRSGSRSSEAAARREAAIAFPTWQEPGSPALLIAPRFGPRPSALSGAWDWAGEMLRSGSNARRETATGNQFGSARPTASRRGLSRKRAIYAAIRSG